MSASTELIELPYQEVKAKTGIFHNRVTKAIWELYIQDKKLIVTVPNFSFKISPVSKMKFLPVNTLINLEIEFSKPAPDQPLLMHLYAKGIQRATFEAIDKASD